MMQTSPEKVRAIVRHYMTRTPGSLAEAGVLLVAQQVGPRLLAELPADPDELDALLEQVAGDVLSLRSDDAPRVVLDASHSTGVLPILGEASDASA